MNQRIQEFRDQAKASVPSGLEPEQWLDIYHTKFAELIVRECAEIADKNSPLSYPDHGIKIKRHFGVE
jgi:hypothetical protein